MILTPCPYDPINGGGQALSMVGDRPYHTNTMPLCPFQWWGTGPCYGLQEEAKCGGNAKCLWKENESNGGAAGGNSEARRERSVDGTRAKRKILRLTNSFK